LSQDGNSHCDCECRYDTLSNGAEALALVQQCHFDAIVLDIAMPGMNGWELFEAIRQLPYGKQVPIILFTAYHDPMMDKRAKEVGIYALLRKPITPEAMLDVIQDAISSNPY
jgi:CheY-like chemotaxis protein